MLDAALALMLRLRRLPLLILYSTWWGLRSALCDLLLLILLAHGTAHGFKTRLGVLLGDTGAQPLPQLLQGCFGVCAFLWHGQATSDLASSKQRATLILALS